ncbi:SAF domain-containing protein [Pengzhenrongella sicca]|uniref:SAF domain-containing protein n=1 Tax=Pengzhenrongella sicca TaxID=2819238 RepID=A0A8A4ZGB6_9MICO|nr:SAF domain-containing protein [Pengzhenrongella sicca]QTE30039.1 SAF domain-containing protein [Pengzhenrongella sicca]
MVALASALAIVGALGASWLVGSAGDRVAVVALARDVAYGSAIESTDLTVTDVAVDGSVATVPASDVDAVVGKFAAGDLVAGALLARKQVTSEIPPAAGQVLVPLPVSANRLPAGGLRPRDRVLIVDTPTADADPPTTAPSSVEAEVMRIGSADLNGVSVVDVVAPTRDGPTLAARAATGRFALVVLPRQVP